jgi:hypothetical protein
MSLFAAGLVVRIGLGGWTGVIVGYILTLIAVALCGLVVWRGRRSKPPS